MTKLSQGYNRRYALYNASCLLLFEITEKSDTTTCTFGWGAFRDTII